MTRLKKYEDEAQKSRNFCSPYAQSLREPEGKSVQ